MNEKIEFLWLNRGEGVRLYKFLCEVDDIFIPKLSERVNIKEYAEKLAQNAENIVACYDEEDVGACSIYCNLETAFISSFAVKNAYMRMKIGSQMMEQVKEHARASRCRSIKLEVFHRNSKAMKFYEKQGFVCAKHVNEWFTMEYKL